MERFSLSPAETQPTDPCVLFVTSNGAGLGHLTRLMGISRRLPSSVRCVFATMSQGLPLLARQGFDGEYIPTAQRLGLSAMAWNRYLAIRMVQLIDQYTPTVVVLDATLPFEGLAQAFQRRPDPRYVWCRRAMWKLGVGAPSVSREDLFDLVLEPGEVASAADVGVTLASRAATMLLEPMVYLRESEVLSRREARAELDLPKDPPCALVQLGAGNINDLETDLDLTLRVLAEAGDDLEVVVAQSVISNRILELPAGVRAVREFPLARLYRAFDFVISAAGYNSFHELISLGIPSVFLPNLHTRLDDQLARARFAHAAGIAICVETVDEASIRSAVHSMLDPKFRKEMREELSGWASARGASQAASIIDSLATGE